MKLVYSHENSIVAGNIKNLLELAHIKVIVKNEFASGAVGDLSAFDAWIELWVGEQDENKAIDIVQRAVSSQASNTQSGDWFCRKCKELNDANFEICWNCQFENT